MAAGVEVTPTVLLSREQWATQPALFNGRPPVYFGCRWCRAPLRYDGMLTADGYAVEPMSCPACGTQFGIFLHGWAQRPAPTLCQSDGGCA